MSPAHVELIHYLKIGIDVTVADIVPLHALFISSIDNFVVYIGKVLHMSNVVALMLQKTADNIPGNKGTGIAYMGMIVRRYAAHIDISLTGIDRYKFFFLLR